jgi:hypothetical protein
VHTYKRPNRDAPLPPNIGEFRFNDAVDVVAYAERDLLIGLQTWPEVWHLDETGMFQCYFKGSSCDSLVRWADEPWPLERSRAEGLAHGGCVDRWVIVDSRLIRFTDPPDEGDVRAFLDLRSHLNDVIGVDLVDAVVFDDRGHWWSMHELTSGTTAWIPPPARRRGAA